MKRKRAGELRDENIPNVYRSYTSPEGVLPVSSIDFEFAPYYLFLASLFSD